MKKELRKDLDILTEEELLFQLEAEIGNLAPYYADRFANRAKKELFDDIENKFKEQLHPNGAFMIKIYDKEYEEIKKRNLSTTDNKNLIQDCSQCDKRLTSDDYNGLCFECFQKGLSKKVRNP